MTVSSLGYRSLGLGEDMQDLVGAVSGDRAVVERQRRGVGDMELARGPALGGGLDHGRIQVDADGGSDAFTDVATLVGIRFTGIEAAVDELQAVVVLA